MAHTGSQMSQAEKPVWILQSVYASSPVKLLPFQQDELMNAASPTHISCSGVKMLKPLPLKILKPHSPAESKLGHHAEIHAKYLQASSPRPFHAKPRYCGDVQKYIPFPTPNKLHLDFAQLPQFLKRLLQKSLSFGCLGKRFTNGMRPRTGSFRVIKLEQSKSQSDFLCDLVLLCTCHWNS